MRVSMSKSNYFPPQEESLNISCIVKKPSNLKIKGSFNRNIVHLQVNDTEALPVFFGVVF